MSSSNHWILTALQSSPALILLAAGGSTRMGRPKQLLAYRGTTLLGHAATVAIASRCRPITVVIGAGADQMRTALDGLSVQIVENLHWERGMGSSIRAGMEAISAGPAPSAIVIMLCDQPGVNAVLLNQLIELHQRQASPIVACAYDGIAGVPALFDRSLLDELRHLPDLAGARELIRRYGDRVATVPFPMGTIDVDTPLDYEGLRLG